MLPGVRTRGAVSVHEVSRYIFSPGAVRYIFSLLAKVYVGILVLNADWVCAQIIGLDAPGKDRPEGRLAGSQFTSLTSLSKHMLHHFRRQHCHCCITIGTITTALPPALTPMHHHQDPLWRSAHHSAHHSASSQLRCQQPLHPLNRL